MGGDWAEMLQDLLMMIVKRMEAVEDFMAFRGVCKSWRAAATTDQFAKSWPKVPLLMLAEEEDRDDREFYSVSKGKVCMKLSVPEAKGKKCMESRFGWFLAVDSSGNMSLLHPFSRTTIELPPQHSIVEYDDFESLSPFRFVERSVLSANPSDTKDFILMIVHSGGHFLGFWRPKDESWTRIESRRGAFSDVHYYKGKFYAVSFGGYVWVWDALATDLTVAENLFCIDRELVKMCQPYLVECSGDLHVVARDGVDSGCYGATYFQVLQLDLTKREWGVITNLGDWSMFVGHNAAFSVDTNCFPGSIKPNCIYFSDDSIEAYRVTRVAELGGGKDMGVYNLQDGSIERFQNVLSFSLIGPPVWVAPCL